MKIYKDYATLSSFNAKKLIAECLRLRDIQIAADLAGEEIDDFSMARD